MQFMSSDWIIADTKMLPMGVIAGVTGVAVFSGYCGIVLNLGREIG